MGKGGTQKVGSLVIHPFTGYKNAINHFDNHLAAKHQISAEPKKSVRTKCFG